MDPFKHDKIPASRSNANVQWVAEEANPGLGQAFVPHGFLPSTVGLGMSPRVPIVQPTAKVAGRPLVRQVGGSAAAPATRAGAAVSTGDVRRSAGGSLTARNLRSSKSQDVRAPSAPRAASPAAPARPRQTSPAPRQTSPAPRPATVAAPPGRPATTPTTSTANRERSLGASRSTVSTGSLAVRPQTARAAVAPTTQRAQSARRNQTPSTARTARPQSVRRSESDTLTRSQSRVSPRPRSASSGRNALGVSKSASQLMRVSNGHSTPGSPNTPVDLPSVEELKRMIAETKKEVREIRAVESKTKWQVTREERKDKLAQTIATQSELREWRWKQAEGMKALAMQRAQEAKMVDLKESKDYLEFKREAKLRSKEEEIHLQSEVYHDRKKDSAWNVAKAQEAVEQEQALVREKVDDVVHLREEKKHRVEQDKVTAAQERALQEHGDLAHLARQLAAEKERLLENLQFSRSCLQAPLRRR
eukprot:symbB.v1.2.024178.t1/scaffold2268.1/size83883/2